MRIFVLIDRYRPILGGAQNNVHELSRRLSAMGFSVTVQTRRVYRGLDRDETIEGVRVRRRGWFPVRLVSKILCFLSILGTLVLRKNDYDVVLCVPCVESTDLLPAYYASLVTGRPFVVRLTGLPTFLDPPEDELGVRLRNMLIPGGVWKKVLARAAVIVTQSRVLDQVADAYTAARSVIIPNGVDSDRFRPVAQDERARLRERLGLPADRVLLVNTGRYDYQKDQITLIRAAERIERAARPGTVHVVILGATQRNQATSNEEEIKRYVVEHGLESLVTFVDDTDDVEGYLRAADVFCHPTLGEGMSNALVEAMACGLPVTCTDIPQETCLFPEERGYFFPPSDVDALEGHLLSFIDSAGLRRSYGAELARFAAENYVNEHLVHRYAELLGAVVAGEITEPGGEP